MIASWIASAEVVQNIQKTYDKPFAICFITRFVKQKQNKKLLFFLLVATLLLAQGAAASRNCRSVTCAPFLCTNIHLDYCILTLSEVYYL